jgi:hypothetical protein
MRTPSIAGIFGDFFGARGETVADMGPRVQARGNVAPFAKDALPAQGDLTGGVTEPPLRELKLPSRRRGHTFLTDPAEP